jgi:hypothetical protein
VAAFSIRYRSFTVKRILTALFILLALAGTRGALALGLGGSFGQESLSVAERRPGGSAAGDLSYQKLDVKLTTMKFTLLDLSKPMSTGLYGSDKSGDESFWNRRAAIGEPEHGTQWIHGTSTLSYIMGSSTGAEEVLTAGASAVTPAPASTNSFWGVEFDMGLGQYQFLKLPLELSTSYDVQFRSYTFSGVFDGVAGKAADAGGMSVNGLFSAGADLGVIPGLVVSARIGYDPLMAVVGSLYPDLISPGYRLDGGAEWMPLKFVSVFAAYEQYTTGFFGIGRTVTITDLSFGGRIYFY